MLRLTIAVSALVAASRGARDHGTEALEQDQLPSVAVPLTIQPLTFRDRVIGQPLVKQVPVLRPSFEGSRGVQVVASETVPDAKLMRAASVLGQYLDNDEDGEVDNSEVAKQMELHGATLIMFGTVEELEQSDLSGIPGFGHLQDVEAEETSPVLTARLLLLGADDFHCALNPSLICDATLEEAFHLVTDAGYAHAYPSLFGTKPGSALAVEMEHLIQDCGYAWVETSSEKYASFQWPDCTGRYHYSDETCEYGCLVTEYFHHFVASFNGEYANTGCPVKPQEWELCMSGNVSGSQELLYEYAAQAWKLILDPAWQVPRKMPSGHYIAAEVSVPKEQAEQEVVQGQQPWLSSVGLGSFRIGLPRELRQQHRRQSERS